MVHRLVKALEDHAWLRWSFIMLGIAVAFSNIYGNTFVMDDHDFIVDWPLIQNLHNWPSFFAGYIPPEGQEGIYSPLKTVFHALFYHAFGLNPLGYHVVSVLIHILSVVFVYNIIRFLTKDTLVAFLSAVLFSLHPAHAEAIVYLTASVDMIGIMFLFASFYFYVAAEQQAGWRYGVSVVCAVLAVYTHELAISLPVLCLWHDYCFSKDPFRRKWLRALPFVVIVLSYIAAKYLVLGGLSRGAYLMDSVYLTQMVVIKALAKYIWICFFPIVLTHNHMIAPGISSFDPDDFDKIAVLSQSVFEARVLIALLTIGAVVWLALRSFEKKRALAFAIGWFFICLLPVSHIVPSGVYFAERYLYPGMLGFALALGFVFAQGLRSTTKARIVTACAFITISCLYAGRLWLRSGDWKDDVTLYEKAVLANPQSALMKNDLGIVYAQHGQLEKAIAALHEALAIRPNDPVTYFTLGNVYVDIGEWAKGMDAFKQATIINPQYGEAYYNLAGMHARIGQRQQADWYLQEALRLYAAQGRHEEAEQLKQSYEQYIRYKE